MIGDSKGFGQGRGADETAGEGGGVDVLTTGAGIGAGGIGGGTAGILIGFTGRTGLGFSGADSSTMGRLAGTAGDGGGLTGSR